MKYIFPTFITLLILWFANLFSLFADYSNETLFFIDYILMAFLFTISAVVIFHTFKTKKYLLLSLSVVAMVYPTFWLYATIQDKFFTSNTPYVHCMEEHDDLVYCEGK